jgi:hypothetical protein
MTDAATPLRFVVLHHTGVPQPHFDLMIEASAGGVLMTWRCDEWPIVNETNLTRLGEHRREYLEYQGPLSGDRGQVTRVAGGTCDVQWLTAHQLNVKFPRASLHVQRLDDDHWLATPRN